MGAADVVPGVSGGTMALILGIYRDLIDAIKSFDLNWAQSVIRFDVKRAIGLPHFHFLVPLLIGILSAVLFFTRVISIPKLLETSPELIYGFFLGLIVGSIVVLFRDLKVWSVNLLGALMAGVVFGYLVVTLVPAETPSASWFIFLSGAIAICAMVLPGISGSFILLILGKYAHVLDGIGHFKLNIIVPVYAWRGIWTDVVYTLSIMAVAHLRARHNEFYYWHSYRFVMGHLAISGTQIYCCAGKKNA